MDIITVSDLPAAMQSAEMIETMVAGANARAARVAPCLIQPTSTAWAASTAYAVGDLVRITVGEFLQATTAGTSSATIPVTPSTVGATVIDGSVTWTRIAPTADHLAEARLILVGALQRWSEAGSGALQSQQTGPFGVTVDTRQRTGFNLWPTEIGDLQALCRVVTSSTGAFSVTPSGGGCGGHMDICSANRYVDQNGNVVFGGAFCSCGAEYTNYEYPLYEGGILSGDYY